MSLSVVPLVTLVTAFLAPLEPEWPDDSARLTTRGEGPAVFDLVGRLEVVAGTGDAAEASARRGGRDAGQLRVEDGPALGGVPRSFPKDRGSLGDEASAPRSDLRDLPFEICEICDQPLPGRRAVGASRAPRLSATAAPRRPPADAPRTSCS